ncbi:MAG: acyl-CoA thioesterase [Clostridiaceae bacterium]|jgi:acyl-CoA thioester hydrolase|nr:acyl-CoA thioesterase [Clostridiaceae bacterium]
MKDILEDKVYYADTDSYGVTWHGTYLRWFEKGRVEWCNRLNLKLEELRKQDIVIPVVNVNVRYKYSAKVNDEILISTELEKFNNFTATFHQRITSKDLKTIYADAHIDTVAINTKGELYRKLPKVLSEAFEKELSQCQTVHV